MKDILTIDISDKYLNLIYGNSKLIKAADSIELEENFITEGIIKEKGKVKELVLAFIKRNRVHCKEVSVSLSGGEFVIRTIELPVIGQEALKRGINYEFQQILRNIGEYYTDYEIMRLNEKDDKKIYEILLVAVSKERVDLIVDLINSCGKKVKVIDILANSIRQGIIKLNDNVCGENIGVLYLNYDVSYIIILNNGIFKIERTLPFGINNIIKDIEREEEFESTYKEKISNISRNLQGVFNQYPRMKNNFDNVLSVVNKTIQFYFMGKTQRTLDKLTIISAVNLNRDTIEYIGQYFSTSANYINSIVKSKCEINGVGKFISSYGLIIKSSQKKNDEINLNPKALKEKSKLKAKNNLPLILVSSLISINVIGITTISILEKNISDKLNVKIAEDIKKSDKNELYSDEKITMYVQYINSVQEIEEDKKYKYLKELMNIIDGNVIVNKFTLEESRIVISGNSYDKKNIAMFIKDLQHSKTFANSKIKNIKLNHDNIFDFEIEVGEVL